MHSPEERFNRLARLSRGASSSDAAPGFRPALATRVLARLRTEGEDVSGVWERLCLRAVPFAAAAAVLCFLLVHVTPAPADDQRLAQSLVEDTLP